MLLGRDGYLTISFSELHDIIVSMGVTSKGVCQT